MQHNPHLIGQRIRLRSQYIRDFQLNPFCARCWKTIRIPVITGNCLHQFCFNCLVKWCQARCTVGVAVLCPLCKFTVQTVLCDIRPPNGFRELTITGFIDEWQQAADGDQSSDARLDNGPLIRDVMWSD